MRQSLIFVVSIILITGFGLSQANSAQTKATTETTVMVKEKVPEGVKIQKNKVTLQEGYTFEKVSDHKVNVVSKMRGGNGITGSFDCTCNGNDGGCDVIVTGSSVSCAQSTCGSSCYMIVTIPGPKTLHRVR